MQGVAKRDLDVSAPMLKLEGHPLRLVSPHDGATVKGAREAIGFDLIVAGALLSVQHRPEQADVISRLDPHNIRAMIFAGNLPGRTS